MKFKNDSQRRAVFANMMGCNKFSFPSEAVLSTRPEYVYDRMPIDQFSMKSDLQGIAKGLSLVELNPKYAAELRRRAHEEREKTERVLATAKFDEDGNIITPVEFVEVRPSLPIGVTLSSYLDEQ
jgi:hypothetical protein